MIPIERAHIFVAGDSDKGMNRDNNEDRFAVSAYHLSSDDPTPSLLAIVADGIGGHLAGEVAAEFAVEMVSQYVADSDAKKPVEILKAAYLLASQTIQDHADSTPGQQGMGATCVSAWIIKDKLYVANVGDSRLYLVRSNKIQRLSVDHTWVQEAVDHGALSPDQAKQHPYGNVIRRYLGSIELPEPDFRLRLHAKQSDNDAEKNQGMTLQPNDRLILCSDGLTDLVEDQEILENVNSQSEELAVKQLINIANDRGGRDNITVVVIRVPEEV